MLAELLQLTTVELGLPPRADSRPKACPSAPSSGPCIRLLQPTAGVLEMVECRELGGKNWQTQQKEPKFTGFPAFLVSHPSVLAGEWIPMCARDKAATVHQQIPS